MRSDHRLRGERVGENAEGGGDGKPWGKRKIGDAKGLGGSIIQWLNDSISQLETAPAISPQGRVII